MLACAAGGAQRRGARGKQQGTAGLRIVILDELDGLLGSAASLLVRGELPHMMTLQCFVRSHRPASSLCGQLQWHLRSLVQAGYFSSGISTNAIHEPPVC